MINTSVGNQNNPEIDLNHIFKASSRTEISSTRVSTERFWSKVTGHGTFVLTS